jgi:hypothetical protein
MSKNEVSRGVSRQRIVGPFLRACRRLGRHRRGDTVVNGR